MAEVSAQPVAEDWEQAEESLERLDIKDADPEQIGDADTKHVMESAPDSPSAENETSPELTSTSPNKEETVNVVKEEEEEEEHAVDHALRDALSRHKHRNSVLRLEAEVEDFVLKSTEPSHNFSGEMSSYDRLLVHRTAQHWGLDTSTLSQGPDHGSILAVRTVRTGPPQIKLTDLPVTMEEPVIPVQPVQPMAAGDGDGAGGAVSAPKVLVRRGDRPRGGTSNHSPGQHNGFSHQRHQHSAVSIEEKEINYEKVRARIFGAGGTGENNSNPAVGGGGGLNNVQGMYPQQHMMPHHPQMMMANHYHAMQMQQQQQQQHGGGGGGGGQGQGQGHAYNGSGNLRTQNHQQHQLSNQSVGNNASSNARNGVKTNNAAANNTNTFINNTNSTKAQLRNRQEDLSDPDFRRGRRNTGPRFDPGFGEDMMIMHGGGGGSRQGQGMYVRPTYSTEFPSLGGGGGVGGGYHNLHQPSPGAGGGYMLPYAYAGQGTLNNSAAAAGSAQGYPMHPGHMYAATAASGGGNGGAAANNMSSANQMQMQMQYQQQQGYAMASGPYGHYIPIRPGDGTGGMVPVMYMNNDVAGQHGTGTGPVMYHPGSPSNAMGGVGMQHMMPMSPSAAAAMASPKSGSGGGGNWNQYQQQHQQQQYHYHGGGGGGGGSSIRQQQHVYQQQRGGANTSQQTRNQQRGGGNGNSNSNSNGGRESTSVAITPRAESSISSEKPPFQQQKQSKQSVEEEVTSAPV
ncbi:hypothetical protein Ndes2526B_g00357 [Nannochloris sp. 'desiccata']|nr:hypothetical protein NADE_002202 [Chlorella desiccata (nom. nud.)]